MNNSKILFIFLIFFPILILCQYKNIPYFKTTGLFYENLGTVKISNSDLILLTYVNITHINQGYEMSKIYYEKTKQLCQHKLRLTKVALDNQCVQSLKIIERTISEITEKHEIINHATNIIPQNSRVKRGIINGVSSGLKWLFGTPSADDAQFYTDSINTLINDNKQTQTLLKSQIEIISSTIRNFNNSVFALKQSEEQMNSNIRLINSLAYEVTNQINDLKLDTAINNQFITLSAFVNQLNLDYDNYIQSITLGRHGILSHLVVTPKNIYEEISLFQEKHKLPIIPRYENIFLYYNIIKLQVLANENLIIFAMKVPLVNTISYDIYHLIPLPIQHENNSYYSYIEPKQKFLIYSNSKTQYTLMQDLTNCIALQENKFICKNVHTYTRSEKPSCEVELLTQHITSIPESCNTNTIKASISTFNYLSNNNWIYVFSNPTLLTLVCGKEHSLKTYDVVLQNTGILTIEPECTGYTDYFILETTGDKTTNITYYIPSINIIQDECCDFNKLPVDLKTIQLDPVKLINVDLSELKYANKKLQDFDEILNDQINKPFIIRHMTWYNVLFSILGAILFFMLLINCCRWCGCFNLIKKFCCFTKSPNDNSATPALFKTFINCCFDKKSHQDIIKYNRRQGSIQSMSPYHETEMVQIYEDVNLHPIQRSSIRPKSTHQSTMREIQESEIPSRMRRSSTVPI